MTVKAKPVLIEFYTPLRINWPANSSFGDFLQKIHDRITERFGNRSYRDKDALTVANLEFKSSANGYQFLAGFEATIWRVNERSAGWEHNERPYYARFKVAMIAEDNGCGFTYHGMDVEQVE